MDGESQKAGLVVSGAMHLALLAVLVIGFARPPRFDDAPESIPVETITSTQLNEIMQGEKTGKPAPAPPKAAPQPPEPPKPEPPPPEPPKRPEPPPPEPAKPPPPKPPPPKPEPPPPEPPKRPEPPPKPEAEDAPSPPVRPRPQKPEETPRPPDRPRVAKAEETPKPDKFKPDDIARTLAREKAEEKPKPKPPAFDPNAINKLLGQGRTAEAKPNPAPPQGLANHNAPRMSVSLENALNEWFRDSYKNCWNLPPTNPEGENYVFDVRVTFNPDGSLSGRPVMLNPPHDPEWRAHAESVMRAVQRCNPLHIPNQYAPFFDQWRSKTIHFDPASAEG